MQRFSIIIPAHNEAATVARVIRAARLSSAAEIIVVDDGSTDATASISIALALADSRVRLVRHAYNRGAMAAWASGIRSATQDVLVFYDADVTTVQAGHFDQLAEAVCRGDADYVIGSFPGFGRITEYLVRPLLREFVPALAALTQPISGMIAVHRSFLRLDRMGTGYAVLGILLDAYCAGARIHEVNLGPIIHDKRPDAAKAQQAHEECERFFAVLRTHACHVPSLTR